MKILLSNPDTLGDLVLRQPLFAELAAAGHALALIFRTALSPLASLVAPTAALIPLDTDPYASEASWDGSAVEWTLREAARFDPDVLVLTPFQRTLFDERLAARLPRARLVAMRGKLFRGDVDLGVENVSSLSVDGFLAVAEATPETEKNGRLATAILGRAMRLPEPKLQASAAQLDSARALLSRFGLQPESYVVACVGESPATHVRNWPLKQWSLLLREWISRHDTHVLFTGTPEEHEAIDTVRRGMGVREESTRTLAPADSTLDALLGVVALSKGYVGRDTGPMHVAGAMGKPVIAVFGGGTWPRFLPASAPSCALTVDVPCAGCDWICHLKESHCVKAVPVEAVLKAVDDLHAGKLARRETRVVAPDTELLHRLVTESAESAREERRASNRLRRARHDQLAALKRRYEELYGDLSQAHHVSEARLTDAEARLARFQQDLALVTSALEETKAARDGVNATLQETEATLAGVRGELEARNLEIERLHGVETTLHAEIARLLDVERELGQEIVLHQGRVGALLSSRWRRLGLATRLARPLPWETP